MTDTKHADLMKIGATALASIREMVAALQCDRERLEELREERDSYEPSDGEERLEQTENATLAEQWAFDNSDDAAELAELESACTLDGEEVDEEQARERIQQDALSVEFRCGWTTGRQEVSWDEAKILLTTGGPAVQIMVELQDGEPHRAYLQVQDWGTAWTDYYEEGIGDVLLAYCQCFYFGD